MQPVSVREGRGSSAKVRTCRDQLRDLGAGAGSAALARRGRSRMSDLTAEVEELYARYLEVWNARDFEGVARCFSEPAMFVLPTAAVSLPDRAAVVALLQKVFAGLEANGFSHSTIGGVTARACGEGLAIVDARDVRRLRADGSAIEVIDGHCVLRKEQGAWMFTTVVTCAPGWQGS